MSRRKTPLAIAKLTGAHAHNKKRFAGRSELELPNDIPGEGPAYLPELARAEWRRLLENSKYRACLSSVDAGLLEVYCVLRAEFIGYVQAAGEMPAPRIAQMITIASRLGLTPADRTKIGAPKTEEKRENRFSKLASKVVSIRKQQPCRRGE